MKKKDAFKLQDNTKFDDLGTYDDVLNYLSTEPNRTRTINLLIGNGFSMAYNKDIFSYKALSDFIMNLNNDKLKALFKVLETENFEEIMGHLDVISKLLEVFDGGSNLIPQVQEAEEELRNGLITAIQEVHPEYVFKVPDRERKHCCDFIKPFIARKGKIFSTNYDLLLYWVLMSNGMDKVVSDGFGRYGDDSMPLEWGKHQNIQNIFYLHGALFIFDEGSEVIKETYSSAKGALIEAVKKRIHAKHYPIFVTAGNAEQKLKHIAHNQYLSFCYKSLCQIHGSVITHGLSFNKNDFHIIEALNKASMHSHSHLLSVYVGVFSENDLTHIKEISKEFKMKLNVYDARTVRIWR